MEAKNWQRARELFDELVELSPDQWSVQLDALGDAVDAVLRADVLALLRGDGGNLVQTNIAFQAPNMLASLADDDADAQRQHLAGRNVGPFRLLRELGQGGMGTVWLAERIDGQFQQQVAIKLIRTGWDTSGVMDRFRAERQILAGLTHPNIARLIDGGVVGDDRPWLALEFVDGVDLPRYCDQHHLSLAKRLQLFLTVCDAVSHAHARLIVHRDLKPSNLLVTAAGEVKLLDFGIAKLIDPEVAQTSATRMFTPEYAAPEQVRGEPVTTSVDVYALGVLLFELLTGRNPYRVEKATPTAYERAILDQEPTRPSASVTRGATDANAAVAARQRELTPHRLRHELRGDLDAIVLKALRKDPAQRYASVADMASDIGNYLARRPVVARRGGRRYRAQRFVRRYAIAVGFAVIAAVALATGLALALWQADEARMQRDLARSESDKSSQTVDFLLDVFRSADPAQTQGRKVTAEELLERSADRINQHDFSDPAVRYDLLVAMGEAYLGIGNGAEAHALFDQARVLQENAFPDDALKRARVLVLLARGRGGTDDIPLAKKYLDEASRILPAASAESELAADLHVSKGIMLMAGGDLVGAIAEMSVGVDLLTRLRGPDDATTASAAITLSWAYADQDREQEARTLLEPIVAALRNAPTANPVRFADALDALANVYTARHEAAEATAMRKEALEITRRVYGESHAYVLIRLNNLAASLMRVHDYAGANAAMKQSVALIGSLDVPDARAAGSSLNNLASTEYALGNWGEAERLWDQALAIRRKATDATDVAYSLTGSAAAARAQGRLDVARTRIDEALDLLRAHPSPKPTHLARTLIERVEIGMAAGDRPECDLAEEAASLMHANTGAGDAERLYVDAIAAACALRAADTPANRKRVNDTQDALLAELPADSARVKHAQRYAVPE